MNWIFELAPGFTLTLARTTAMVSAMMFLGTTGDSKMPRIVLAFTLSALLFARRPEFVSLDGGISTLALLVAREVVLGLLFGFTIQLLFVALRITGELLGHEMGFSMAQVVDPTTGTSSPVVARFFETIAFLFLLEVNAHHEAFRILSELFDRIRIGTSWNLEAVVSSCWNLAGSTMQTAVLLATPVYACLILLTIVLVVLSRAVPQIHLMEFGYAIRILVAMFTTWLFFDMAAPHVYRLFESVFSSAHHMIDLATAS
ncbi:MAG: flagellar biosynthetic protein FliR [Planctomycetes bacterium]|nr:flagellar biosynthetic protein FliR [Planctomycetota bacterium]